MIIENSFFKLPEILHNLKATNSSQKIKEASLVNYFSMAIIAEFNSRNIDNPFKNIQTEKQFPKAPNKNCDLYISLKGIYDEVFKSHYYLADDNYCEVKFYFGFDKKKANVAQTTTENAGYILNDLVRLQQYTGEKDGRYFLVFFDSNKWNYLPKTKSNGQVRQWLVDIFHPGSRKTAVDLSNESKSLKNKIKSNSVSFNFDFVTYEISNLKESDYFNGYLIKILDGAPNS